MHTRGRPSHTQQVSTNGVQVWKSWAGRLGAPTNKYTLSEFVMEPGLALPGEWGAQDRMRLSSAAAQVVPLKWQHQLLLRMWQALGHAPGAAQRSPLRRSV